MCSLMLSLIAIMGVVTIGKDAAFYLDIARQVSEHGVSVANERFNWPAFIFLLAGTHTITGLPLELVAYLWCALFMAGTCALIVDAVRRQVPPAAGWAFLVVLAIPAFNQFRSDIIREFGFWFFSVLSIWLALRWRERPGFWRAISIHGAIFGAALFRLEAVALLIALVLWQLPGLKSREGRWNAAQLWGVPFLVVCCGMAYMAWHGGLSSTRMAYYLGLITPGRVLESFRVFSEQFGNSMTYKYSRDAAGQIIFFGMLAVVLIRFAKLCGPFVIPFFYRGGWQALDVYRKKFSLFAYAAILYLLVLMLFFVREQFINSRYLSFLNLLAVPMLAVGAMLFAERFPRFGKCLVVIALLVMLSNVLSFGAKKTHYVEAGRWVAENVAADALVYYEDSRIAYYAGRGYPFIVIGSQQAMSEAHAHEYGYFLIEANGDEPWLGEWLTKHDKRVLAAFTNRKGERVLAIGD